jgi:hypothetical protein
VSVRLVPRQAYIPICVAQVTLPASHGMLDRMSTRVLVVALVLQLLAAGAFAAWAASGFPLP